MRMHPRMHAALRFSLRRQLRTLFPRIVVRYEATEDDITHKLALPEVLTAYLTSEDVEEME